MPLEPGLQATVQRTVTEADTATALGSGDVPVLATPILVALCEAAAVDAVSEAVPADQTTVGIRVEIDHLAPTAIGSTVLARAELVEVDGRTLRFSVEASDASGVVARGTHVRVIVDRARFLEGAASR